MSRGYPVPKGTAVLHERLRGSELHTALKSKVKVHLEGGLGGVDVLPSPSVGCIYLTGDEVTSQLSSSATRSRLTDLAKSGVVGVVLVGSGGVRAESYPPLQNTASLELGLQTIPVTSPDHAARYITELVKRACDSDAGPALATPSPPVDQALFHTVQCLPHTGPVKARKLLEHFNSLKCISEAPVNELQEIVGAVSAKAIHSFLHQRLS